MTKTFDGPAASIDHVDTRAAGQRRGALDARLPPPIVALAVALAMGGAAAVLPPAAMVLSWRVVGSTVLFIAAGLFGPRAIRAFGRAGTTINPVAVEQASSLVTTGVFARTRNPMYVSMALLLASLACGLGRWPLLLGPLAFVLFITRFQIVPEERALTARFGEAYAAYRARVRRWL